MLFHSHRSGGHYVHFLLLHCDMSLADCAGLWCDYLPSILTVFVGCYTAQEHTVGSQLEVLHNYAMNGFLQYNIGQVLILKQPHLQDGQQYLIWMS